jgi:methionyl aminopeptidase
MSIQTEADLIALKRIGKIVASCLKFMGEHIQPGITTAELDAIGAKFLLDAGARAAPRLFYGFPATTCISVNDVAAHGIPGAYALKAGDLVNIDVSAELGGFVADTGGSFTVTTANTFQRRLLTTAKLARDAGIAQARAGAPLRYIGKAMESTARKHGFTVIENLGSHGVGRALHEEPGFIPGYHDPKDRRVLEKGMVITVEPFVSNGASWAEDGGDGWALLTPGRFSAQFEHTIVITDGAPLILTHV